MRSFLLIFAILVLTGCDGKPVQPLPKHQVETSTLAPKEGLRVQVNVPDEAITDTQCKALVEEYASQAEPDGQVSVHMPSVVFEGQVLPFCVDNFDGEGIKFNRNLFGQTDGQ